MMCSQILICVAGLPKQTAKYLPSMEKVTDHAGDPLNVDGESVPVNSRDDDDDMGRYYL